MREEMSNLNIALLNENNGNKLSKMEIVLNQAFDKTISAAQNLQIGINSGKVDQAAPSVLTGITDFNNFPSETIDYINHNVTFRDDGVNLRLKFMIHLLDKSSVVVHPKGFTHWNLN